MTRKPREILPLRAPLEAVHRHLERCEGDIIGGAAASILGKPRITADVDVMILLSVDDLPAFLEAAAQEGLEPRIPDALDFARRHRVLLLRHRESGINVDISLGILPFEQEAVERSQVHRIGSIELRLPTPEDFIIFKAVAHRPVDLEDIRAVIAKHPNLDRERIRGWVQAFAEVLEMPELWEDIAPLLEER
ncbi:MAG: hypothetical protein DRI61_08240 [Chloroflexi bacterium]|nr:MAG: hypothetical protein DRI61_08240 [Chloroflexota bacterium]